MPSPLSPLRSPCIGYMTAAPAPLESSVTIGTFWDVTADLTAERDEGKVVQAPSPIFLEAVV